MSICHQLFICLGLLLYVVCVGVTILLIIVYIEIYNIILSFYLLLLYIIIYCLIVLIFPAEIGYMNPAFLILYYMSCVVCMLLILCAL